MSQVRTRGILADAVNETKVRLSNNTSLRGRNAANSADVNIIKLDSSNRPAFEASPYVVANKVVDESGASFTGAVGVGNAPAASAILDAASTTKGFLPPRMTTTQRDAITSPATGLVIYNTTTSQLNYYNGTAWTALSSGGSTPTPVQETPSGTVNGTNTAFTLAFTPTAAASVLLSLDGLILRQGTDYTISGTSITMTAAPTVGQYLWAQYTK